MTIIGIQDPYLQVDKSPADFARRSACCFVPECGEKTRETLTQWSVQLILTKFNTRVDP